MKSTVAKIRPTMRRTLRARGGRRLVLEGFGQRSPVFVSISGGSDVPVGAWLSPTEFRRFVSAARRILK